MSLLPVPFPQHSLEKWLSAQLGKLTLFEEVKAVQSGPFEVETALSLLLSVQHGASPNQT